DQQMMVAAVRKIVTRVRHAHVAETKTDPKCTLDGCAVRGPDEIQKRVLCRSFSLCLGRTRHKSQSCDQHNQPDNLHRLPLWRLRRKGNPESVRGVSRIVVSIAIGRTHISRIVFPGAGPDDMRSTVAFNPRRTVGW